MWRYFCFPAAIGVLGKLCSIYVLTCIIVLSIAETVAYPFTVFQLHYAVAFKVSLDCGYVWSEPSNSVFPAEQVEAFLSYFLIFFGCGQDWSLPFYNDAHMILQAKTPWF